MTRLALPDVTLVAIFSDNATLTHDAICRCTDAVAFGNGYFDRRDMSSQRAYDIALTRDFPAWCITTSHMLVIQYDSWIIDARAWSDEWLRYDYIGAPWPWQPEGRQVGNGGFSLRSRRLMDVVRELTQNRGIDQPDDVMIAFVLRDELEARGLSFAPREVADAFSFEREFRRGTFGFHGIFNLPRLLSYDEWKAFDTKLAPYVKDGDEYREAKAHFCEGLSA